MQIENFVFKTGHVEIAEENDKKGIVRLKEYKNPFYVFGKTKDKVKGLKRDDVISVIRRKDLKFNWLMFPKKTLTLFTADGSQKKYLWLTTVEETYSNGFYATIGSKRVFFNSNEDVKAAEPVFIEIKEGNFPVFIQNCYCIVPNKIYRCLS